MSGNFSKKLQTLFMRNAGTSASNPLRETAAALYPQIISRVPFNELEAYGRELHRSFIDLGFSDMPTLKNSFLKKAGVPYPKNFHFKSDGSPENTINIFAQIYNHSLIKLDYIREKYSRDKKEGLGAVSYSAFPRDKAILLKILPYPQFRSTPSDSFRKHGYKEDMPALGILLNMNAQQAITLIYAPAYVSAENNGKIGERISFTQRGVETRECFSWNQQNEVKEIITRWLVKSGMEELRNSILPSQPYGWLTAEEELANEIESLAAKPRLP